MSYIILVKVIWDETNETHIARHGVSREQVEALMVSADFAVIALSGTFSLLGEGTVAGRFLRIIFMESVPGEVYPLTAYPVARRRSRT